jgi:hypothetical protein
MRLQKIPRHCFGRCHSLAKTGGIDKINRPSHLRRAIGFDLRYLSTSKASPNDTGIVIIVIIIVVGEGFA